MSETTVYSGLAGRYSSALFELAEVEKILDEVSADLDLVLKLLNNSLDLKRLIESPIAPMETQKAVMMELLKKLDAGDLTTKFVCVVVQNRRLLALSDMINEFQLRLSEHRGQISAEVTSPKALSKNQIKGIVEAIERATKKHVFIREKVDKALLGGLIVRVGSQMVDSSLRTKLNNLHLAMKGSI